MGRRGGAADVLALPAQGRARPAASLSCGQSSPVVSKACPSIVGRLILSWDNTTALLPLAAISVHSHGLEPVPTSYQLFLGALSVAPGFMSESHALPLSFLEPCAPPPNLVTSLGNYIHSFQKNELQAILKRPYPVLQYTRLPVTLSGVWSSTETGFFLRL